MAKPRIFISSTFYDLRQIREDVDRSLKELGYEPIRHETGAIAYGGDERPEAGAYREVDLCDILVAVIGGRYGTDSRVTPGSSITQNEIRRALEKGIQVFIFIEANVFAEYGIYSVNRSTNIVYRYVDNTAVFEFIDQLMALPQNNAIAPFGIAADISGYLREQFAGLFQRFLQAKRREAEINAIQSLRNIADTLKSAVEYLSAQANARLDSKQDEGLQSILHYNHPVFARLAALTKTPYRVYFSNRKEFLAWISARGWTETDPSRFDPDSIDEFNHAQEKGYLKITEDLFDESGRLRNISPANWNDDCIKIVEPGRDADRDTPLSDDDIPF